MENNQVNSVKNIFNSPDYSHYMVQYQGVINEDININNNIYITVIDQNYAIFSFRIGSLSSFIRVEEVEDILGRYIENLEFRIVYIQPPDMFTLEQISAIEAAQVNLLQAELPLNLTGRGVVVGIIDTGIDYLSDEFTDSEGRTRINAIWDQTIDSNINEGSPVPFGAVYTKEQINSAIAQYKSGGNPYDIVPSIDEDGHGTNMAGIVGATGKNPSIKGVAPNCEFVIVKLAQALAFKKLNGIEDDVKVYNSPVIFAALRYLNVYLLREKKPLVILLPLGSTSGNHRGQHILDDYIESVSSNVGIVLVTGSGNEGIGDGHVSGIIENLGDEQVIEVLISEEQRAFYIGIWVDLPNIIDINLISPSGQSTGFIQAVISITNRVSFTFEKTIVNVLYDLPESYSGDELIRIYFVDISPGIWRVRLRLRRGRMANYNAWMFQQELIAPGTRFTPSDPYGTVTIPADSDFVITVAAYNQNNFNLLAYSGVGFRQEYIVKIDFAAGGVNTMTVGLNNTIQVINGTSLSAAVGAGACVLLFEWGIVNGNYPFMYTQSIKTFLRRGTITRRGDVYPNPQLGYGIINFYRIFENMV